MVIVFPNVHVQLCGYPQSLSLTSAEVKALHQIKLGGMGALRTEVYSVACRTVTSLVRKGLLGRDNPTAMGRYVIDSL